MEENEKHNEGAVVYIYDDQFKIASDGDVAQLQEVADYVDRKMREVDAKHKGRVPKAKLAVLTAMEITVDLFGARQENKILAERAHVNIDRLTKLVEERASEYSDLTRRTSPSLAQLLRPQTEEQGE
ncbi:MAG: cell division protein ZapA [Candidatus Latescibacteria bacterium]|nr:cell division protein ZapA [Candidatus Latescibacterota bacterium]